MSVQTENEELRGIHYESLLFMTEQYLAYHQCWLKNSDRALHQKVDKQLEEFLFTILRFSLSNDKRKSFTEKLIAKAKEGLWQYNRSLILSMTPGFFMDSSLKIDVILSVGSSRYCIAKDETPSKFDTTKFIVPNTQIEFELEFQCRDGNSKFEPIIVRESELQPGGGEKKTSVLNINFSFRLDRQILNQKLSDPVFARDYIVDLATSFFSLKGLYWTKFFADSFYTALSLHINEPQIRYEAMRAINYLSVYVPYNHDIDLSVDYLRIYEEVHALKYPRKSELTEEQQKTYISHNKMRLMNACAVIHIMKAKEQWELVERLAPKLMSLMKTHGSYVTAFLEELDRYVLQNAKTEQIKRLLVMLRPLITAANSFQSEPRKLYGSVIGQYFTSEEPGQNELNYFYLALINLVGNCITTVVEPRGRNLLENMTDEEINFIRFLFFDLFPENDPDRAFIRTVFRHLTKKRFLGRSQVKNIYTRVLRAIAMRLPQR